MCEIPRHFENNRCEILFFEIALCYHRAYNFKQISKEVRQIAFEIKKCLIKKQDYG